jgi:carbon-monoxide dehydrogenase medium subunit
VDAKRIDPVEIQVRTVVIGCSFGGGDSAARIDVPEGGVSARTLIEKKVERDVAEFNRNRHLLYGREFRTPEEMIRDEEEAADSSRHGTQGLRARGGTRRRGLERGNVPDHREWREGLIAGWGDRARAGQRCGVSSPHAFYQWVTRELREDMRIEELEYHAPESLAEACRLLHTLKKDARVLAGGTDLLADLKQGLLTVNNLVALGKIEALKTIELGKEGLRIGALVTPNSLAASKEVHEALPALCDAASSMAGMQIRNLATIGGNLCSAVPSADLPPSLLVSDGSLILNSHVGERKLPVKDFFSGPRKTAIREGEILARILVRKLPAGSGTAYVKYQLRDASALAVVGAAARIQVNNKTIVEARIAIGAAAPTPLLIEEAGDFLAGKEPSAKNFEEAGRIASKGVKPITDLRGSEAYRRDLAGVLTVRALKKALERVQS